MPVILPSDRQPQSKSVPNRIVTLPSDRGKPAPKSTASSLWDELRAVPTDVVKSFAGVAGIPGDIAGGLQSVAHGIAHGNSVATRYLYNLARGTPESLSDTSKAVSGREAATEARFGKQPKILPTSSDIVSAVQRAGVPLPEHKSKFGQASGAVISGLPAAALTGGESLIPSLAKSIAPSLGAWGAGEMAKGTPYETAATVAGGLATGIAQHGGLSLSNAVASARSPATAERLTAKVLQERYPDPIERAKAVAQLSQAKPNPVAGYKPTSAQVLRTPAAAKLEQQVSSLSAKPNVAEPIASQRNASASAISEPSQYDSIWKKPADG